MEQTTKNENLQLLISSLSKAERRHLHLQTKIQEGDKAYVFLLNQYEKGLSPEEVYKSFCSNYNKKNFEAASKYLFKVILDSLLKLREKQDTQTMICNHISKAGILFERELFDEAFAELNRAKRLATQFENDPLLLLVRRTELKYLSALDFKGMNERQLVNKQMKISEIVKYSRNLNQHIQLYDILKYRLTHKGYARSDKQKENLNDLVLSELYLISNTSYQGFEARKLHLLFQAIYYLNSGNYKLSIRFYKELLDLFQQNQAMILNPPIYYLSAIEGILDSLHVAELYEEMSFFLSKLKELEKKDYATEFILKIKALYYYYESVRLIGINAIAETIILQNSHEESLFRKSHLLGLPEQLIIYLNSVILYLYQKDIKPAKKSMNKILSSGKLFHSLPTYRKARLLNLILQTELGNYDFIANEVASIRRSHQQEKPIYQTEKLILWYVLSCPLPFYKPFRQKLYNQFLKKKELILKSKYERQLLKTFDFIGWIEDKLKI